MAAHGVFWKYVGEGLGIDFATILQKDTWLDGLHFLEDLTRWAATYETTYIASTQDAQRLSVTLVETYLGSYPGIIRPLIYQIFLVFTGSYLRPFLG